MSIYEPLKKYLASSNQKTVSLNFSDIEKLLCRPLPKSAYAYKAWWQNGGHTHAEAWTDAGYAVSALDLKLRTVVFSKSGKALGKTFSAAPSAETSCNKNTKPLSVTADSMEVCGYTFLYLQDLCPECDAKGCVKKYYPQAAYDNKAGLPLLQNGDGAFCQFGIAADHVPGVYLWVSDGRIIYIGETADLAERFNNGYGHIAPRNCFIRGQSTNCKMNKVVLAYYESGKTIRLYFCQTAEHKRVELELLNKINTPYNVKDNR